jgi:hypothetical protein
MTARVKLKKISGHESQGAWRQDELIGGKVSNSDSDSDSDSDSELSKRPINPVIKSETPFIVTQSKTKLKKTKLRGF